MRNGWAVVVLMGVGALGFLGVGGCSQVGDRPLQLGGGEGVGDQAMFAAVAMRIHPIFTRVRDWNGDGTLDGIDAEIEFEDRFGDPTKAEGRLVFELYDYRRAEPDPRGDRVVNPWIGSIETVDEQQARWNRTSRTYSFRLAYPQISKGKTYVLQATFEPKEGKRLFDRIILRPEEAGAGEGSGGVGSRPRVKSAH